MSDGKLLLELIAGKFGKDVAQFIQSEFGGSQPYIPLCRQDKTEYVLSNHGKKPIRVIAKELGITVRQVQNILNKSVTPSGATEG